jgi:very-short-patch-repair endonuclease
MAAVLSCGSDAALSHCNAAVLWGILPAEGTGIEVSVRAPRDPRRPGIVVHRRHTLRPEDVTLKRCIPVTTPTCTLLDIAATLARDRLEAAINEADTRDLIDPETLRSTVDALRHRPGVASLRAVLDRRTFTLTDSELERRFLPIARRAGLPPPQTRRYINGFKVDFYWPSLGLVVETDGLRYHRTPAQQARDRLRDQAHVAAGRTCLRFTHAQVEFQSGHVASTLAAVARRLLADRDRRSEAELT